MKKFMFTLGLAALAAPVFADGEVPQTGGKVTFTSEVLASTCAVASESQDIKVVLPQIESNQLENGVGPAKDFTINLEGCPSYSVLAKEQKGKESITVRFLPKDPMHSNLGVLSNTAAEAERAENVGVQLLNDNSAALDFDSYDQNATAISFNELKTNGGYAALRFQARLFAGQNKAITAGKVSASTPFVINYK